MTAREEFVRYVVQAAIAAAMDAVPKRYGTLGDKVSFNFAVAGEYTVTQPGWLSGVPDHENLVGLITTEFFND